MFNKFLVSIITTIVVINLVLIYLAFIKGDKFSNVVKPSTSPTPPTQTNQHIDPFTSFTPAEYPPSKQNDKNDIGVCSKFCNLYTYENLDTITFKRKKALTLYNVFELYNSGEVHLFYKNQDCYDDDQIFAQYVSHTCPAKKTQSEIANRCYSQTGKVIQGGESEKFTYKCNDNKCSGELGYFSFNFSLTTDNTFKDSIVIDSSSRFLKIASVILPTNIKDTLPSFLSDTKDYPDLNHFFTIDDTIINDEYPITYIMNSEIKNNITSKFKINRYDYDGLEFGVSPRGLYGSVIFRALNMYLTIGTSFTDSVKGSKKIFTVTNGGSKYTLQDTDYVYISGTPNVKTDALYIVTEVDGGKIISVDIVENETNLKNKDTLILLHSPGDNATCRVNYIKTIYNGTLNGKLLEPSANLVLKKYDPNNYEESIVWMFMPSLSLFDNLIETNTRCSKYIFSPQECIGNDNLQQKMSGTYFNPTSVKDFVKENSYFVPDNQDKEIPIIKDLSCDKSFMRTQVDIGDTVISSKNYYFFYSWLLQEDSYITDDQTNFEDASAYKQYNSKKISNDEGTVRITDKGTISIPYYAPMYGDKTDTRVVAQDETDSYVNNGDTISVKLNTYISSNDNIYCIENANGDIKAENLLLKYPSVAYEALTGGFVSNTFEYTFLDTTMVDYSYDSEFGSKDATAIAKIMGKNRREVIIIENNDYPQNFGTSIYKDGDVFWKTVNPYDNVITFPNTYFGSSTGEVSSVSINTFGSGYQGYDNSKPHSLETFTYDSKLFFDLEWEDQVVTYNFNTSTDDCYATFDVVFQNRALQNVFIRDPGKNFDLVNGPSTFSINPGIQNLFKLPEITITAVSLINRIYTYGIINESQSGSGLILSDISVSSNGSIKNKVLEVAFGGQGYKVDDAPYIQEYDFSREPVLNTNKATIKIETLKTTDEIFAFDPINQSLFQDGNFNIGSKGLKMVAENDKSNYSDPSPPQLCFVGDIVGTSSNLSQVIDGIKLEPFDTTIGFLKQIIPIYDPNQFITLFNILKTDPFSTETNCDFLKTLQLSTLKYEEDDPNNTYNVSLHDSLIIGKFIPYSKMVLFHKDNPKDKISTGTVIPGQYDQHYNDLKPYSTEEDNTNFIIGPKYNIEVGSAAYGGIIDKIANKGKQVFVNKNYTQFIPFGLDNLNQLTSF